MKSTGGFFPKYTEQQIKVFKSEDQFMDASVELHKQSIGLLYDTAEINYCDENKDPIELTRDQAVIAGNLVRLIKLNTSFLQNTCEHKVEICFIINRCIAETYINLQYLLKNSEEGVIKNYIKNSLITEKDLWNIIKNNIENRDGEVHAIEGRMQESIKRSFEQSDFELDEVFRSSKWKSVASRAGVVANDRFYPVYYGIGSHSVHGNWQDILFNNLSKTDTGFKIKLGWNPVRPQLIDGPIDQNLEITIRMNELFKTNPSLSIKLVETAQQLIAYHAIIVQAHEEFLIVRKHPH